MNQQQTKVHIPTRPRDEGDFGNDITVRGNLGREPEMSYTPTGQACTKFNVAVWSGKNKTMWCSCVAWEDLAEACAEQLGRGQDGKLQYVEIKGYLTERTWKGVKYHDVVVRHVAILTKQPIVTDTEEDGGELDPDIEATFQRKVEIEGTPF